MKFRTALFWMHLAAGVTAGAVILLMSVTGVLLTYERQLIEWSDRDYRSTPPSDQARALPVHTILERLTEERPDLQPSAVTLKAEREAPILIAAHPDAVYVDAFTGTVLGGPTTGVRHAMSRLRAWHRWLALEGDQRAFGKAISGWSNLLFLFIVLSGIYLWVPRQWTAVQVRAVALFRGGLRGKARDFNWHNVVGIWSAVPLAIVVATAAPISFPWANALVYRLVGEDPPSSGARPTARSVPPANSTATAGERGDALRDATEIGDGDVPLDRLLARARAQAPGWRSMNVRLPRAAEDPVVVTIDEGTGGQPQLRSTLTLSAATGDVVRWEPFSSQSAGRRLRSWSRFTHTGEYYGIAGQTVAGLVSAGGALLVWTGLALAVRRLMRWTTRASSAQHSERSSRAA